MPSAANAQTGRISDGSTSAPATIACPVRVSSSVASRTPNISSVKTTFRPHSGLLPSTVIFSSSIRVTTKLRVCSVVPHEDGRADLAILLGDILDAIGEHQRFVPGAENLIGVDRHLDDVADELAFQRHVDGRGEYFIVSVNIPQRKLDPGEDMPRLPVGDLVGELDELAVLDGLAHVESVTHCSEDGRTEDPDLAVLVAEDKPAKPFALLLVVLRCR